MFKKFITNIGDLNEIQRLNFLTFITKTFKTELKNFPNPILLKLNIKFTKTRHRIIPCFLNLNINNLYYKLITNKNNNKTLTCKIYTIITYSYFKNFKKISIKTPILLCEIPYLFSENLFIINKCRRILINQLIRSPGLYYLPNDLLNNQQATYISSNGNWILFNYNFQTKNLSINLKNILKKTSCYNINLITLFILFNLKQKYTFKSKLTFSTLNKLKNLFFNPTKGLFKLNSLSRFQLNNVFNHTNTHDYITVIDLIKIIKNLTKKTLTTTSNIDDLRYKYLRSINDLLDLQLKIGFYTIIKNIKIELQKQTFFYKNNKLNNLFNKLYDSKYLTKNIFEFFKTSQLSQFLDEINPLAELTHKRKISYFGPNGINTNNISIKQRDIQPSFYNKICFIETPEGHNAGLISSLALYTKVNKYGFLETPYKTVKNTLLNNYSTTYLTTSQECLNTINTNSTVSLKESNIGDTTECIKNLTFIKTKNYKYQNLTPSQNLSVGTNCIPFIEHNDTNRALMGANMQRQAVPLLFNQAPLITTNMEIGISQNSSWNIKAISQGKICYITNKKIIIKDKNNQFITYNLKKNRKSNQQTYSSQRINNTLGEFIYTDQLLTKNCSTTTSELALGKNILIAYMPWEGYNYEDAIVINEELVTSNKFKSIHLENLNYTLINNNTTKTYLTNKIPNIPKSVSNKLNPSGLIKLGTFIKPNDILVGQLQTNILHDINESKLLNLLYNKTQPILQDISITVPEGMYGIISDIYIQYKILTKNTKNLKIIEKIQFSIITLKNLIIGDKLSGRHGNKGIIAKILPKENMPFLNNGLHMDILLNPLGIPSRMNVGQLYETLFGLTTINLNKKYKINIFDEEYGLNSSRILMHQLQKKVKYNRLNSTYYNINNNYKTLLRDGRTGEYFDNPITVGISYIIKLIHLVEEKIHARSIGPYSLISEQPLAGKSSMGGQRFGEMEVWALESYGVTNTLQEFLSIKSDTISKREDLLNKFLNISYQLPNTNSINNNYSEAFLTVIRELQSLGLNLSVNKNLNNFTNLSYLKTINLDLFKNFENNLQLKQFLTVL